MIVKSAVTPVNTACTVTKNRVKLISGNPISRKARTAQDFLPTLAGDLG